MSVLAFPRAPLLMNAEGVQVLQCHWICPFQSLRPQEPRVAKSQGIGLCPEIRSPQTVCLLSNSPRVINNSRALPVVCPNRYPSSTLDYPTDVMKPEIQTQSWWCIVCGSPKSGFATLWQLPGYTVLACQRYFQRGSCGFPLLPQASQPRKGNGGAKFFTRLRKVWGSSPG